MYSLECPSFNKLQVLNACQWRLIFQLMKWKCVPFKFSFVCACGKTEELQLYFISLSLKLARLVGYHLVLSSAEVENE
jgi:hypothetical protein